MVFPPCLAATSISTMLSGWEERSLLLLLPIKLRQTIAWEVYLKASPPEDSQRPASLAIRKDLISLSQSPSTNNLQIHYWLNIMNSFLPFQQPQVVV